MVSGTVQHINLKVLSSKESMGSLMIYSSLLVRLPLTIC